MATQRLTIAKIGGDASRATLDLFRDWQKARLVDDPNEWDSEQWSKGIRRRADAWADKLRKLGHEPPILFFAEYIDYWSFCPPARYLGNYGLIQIMADRHELFCLDLPLPEKTRKHLKKVRDEGQFDEDRFFGAVTLEAATGWDKLTDVGVLVFLRQILRGTVDDREIVKSLKAVPSWIRN